MRSIARLVFTFSFALLFALASSSPSDAQPAGNREPSGEETYREACAACHGPDGKGQPKSTVGFDIELPDFTDCGFATPEVAADWMAIVHEGGPVRAFDKHMPAFGKALTGDEIARVVDYVRTFCDDRRWPRGELNLPRALVTEKAFPENEAVLTMGMTRGDEAAFEQQFLYEHRIGSRAQFEIAVPVQVQHDSNGWQRGLGDIAVALKDVIYHSLERGQIFSVGAEAALPTGKEQYGLGTGATIIEPFAAFGQMLPADSFFQLHSGVELSTDRERAEHEVFWRAAFGKTLVQGDHGRSWTPIFELLGARDLDDDAETEWDVVPQVQVSLSRRQHILLSAGLRVPVTEAGPRRLQFLTYLLWDWFDGGFFSGWK